MVSFEEARRILEFHSNALPAEWLALSSAAGSVSAEDVLAPLTLPLFRNSAMDGYAVASRYTSGASSGCPVRFRIAGEVKAGDAPGKIKGAGETLRIMTGAPVPRGADAVIEKEKAVIHDDALIVSTPISSGRHVRFPGEEIKKGSVVLKKNEILNPGSIGFLASMGIDRARVFRKPRVSVVTTGSELLKPGAPLKPGKIYNANGVMLLSALQEMKIRPIFIRQAKDYPKLLRRLLDFALRESDLVILTGGVSTGEYDFVKEILEKAGVQTLFWRVRQKPGKPLFFGKKNDTLIFGLPGNPAAVFTCFYEYVYPAIRLLSGHTNPYLAEAPAELLSQVKPDVHKTLFLKGRVTALPLKNQSSHMLSSLTQTNALLAIDPAVKALEEGDAVTAHLLPYEV